MRRMHLPLDPLPAVRIPSAEGSLGGAGTMSFKTPLEGSNPVGQ